MADTDAVKQEKKFYEYAPAGDAIDLPCAAQQ
jgi:hypothetical protein